jgi:hypothetical protein
MSGTGRSPEEEGRSPEEVPFEGALSLSLTVLIRTDPALL